MIQLGDVVFNHVSEDQLDWIERHKWNPIGQTIRYALAGNPVIIENPRAGRPITLSAELPWCWLESETVEALYQLAMTSQELTLIYHDLLNTKVRFKRDQGALTLTPIDPRRQYYTGSIFLIEVS